VANNNDNTVSIFYGNGSGGFSAGPVLPAGQGPFGVVTGNFNGDGKVEIAVANKIDSTISVLQGNGNGTFQARVVLPVGDSPATLAVGNFNGRDPVDLAVTNTADNTVSVVLSQITQTATATANNITVTGAGTHTLDASYPGDTNDAASVSALTSAFGSAGQVATPGFSIAEETYASPQSVKITDATAGATIYYTTNGATPTTASTKYTAAITVSAPETINAIAVATGLTQSAVASATPTIKSIIATTTTLTTSANPQGVGQNVTYTAKVKPVSGTGVPNGTITAVAEGSTVATLTLSNGTATYISNALPVGTYTLAAEYSGDANYQQRNAERSHNFVRDGSNAGILACPGGTYASPQSVSITDSTSGATIYYTANGTTPTTSSTKYIAAITVSATETIEAIAVAAGDNNSAVASATYTITPSTTGELKFIAVTPCRIADTRNATGAFGGPELAAAAAHTFNRPPSSSGIPSTAVAYSLNATIVPIQSLGYLTIWPAGEAQPIVSTLNSDGRVKANATMTPAGTNGSVSVFASNATQFILDIDGYFVPPGTSASGLEFFPLAPCRAADTPNATGSLGGPSLTGGGAGGRAFPVQSSACGIPSTAKAYSLNITAVPHGSLGYLSTWPTGQAQPVVSTLYSLSGAVTANAAIVPAGSGGAVSIFVSDTADVILDVNGYFEPPAIGGLSLYPLTPCRALDSCSSSGAREGMLTVPIHASTCAPPATAQAHVLNATVIPATTLSHLTLWAAGGTQPNASTLKANDVAVTLQHGYRAHCQRKRRRFHQRLHATYPRPLRLLRALRLAKHI
jgi:hypothetical protein